MTSEYFEDRRKKPELTLVSAWDEDNNNRWHLLTIVWHLNESGQWAGEYGESLGSFDTEEEGIAALELRQQGCPTPIG